AGHGPTTDPPASSRSPTTVTLGWRFGLTPLAEMRVATRQAHAGDRGTAAGARLALSMEYGEGVLVPALLPQQVAIGMEGRAAIGDTLLEQRADGGVQRL